MSSQCTCTTDKEATCIVHPTTRSLKEHIAELEAEVERLRELLGKAYERLQYFEMDCTQLEDDILAALQDKGGE